MSEILANVVEASIKRAATEARVAVQRYAGEQEAVVKALTDQRDAARKSCDEQYAATKAANCQRLDAYKEADSLREELAKAHQVISGLERDRDEANAKVKALVTQRDGLAAEVERLKSALAETAADAAEPQGVTVHIMGGPSFTAKAGSVVRIRLEGEGRIEADTTSTVHPCRVCREQAPQPGSVEDVIRWRGIMAAIANNVSPLVRAMTPTLSLEAAFRDLIEFERACGHELTQDGPGVPDQRTLDLRWKLHKEEYRELQHAIADQREWMRGGQTKSDYLDEIADGLADLIWVCIGTAVRLGIDLPAVWAEVRKTNMAKFGPGSHRREDGKLLKPEGWQPPDVRGIMERQQPLAVTYGPAAVRHSDGKVTSGG